MFVALKPQHAPFDHLFSNDGILPTQVHRTHAAWQQPERRLLEAIMNDAIETIEKPHTRTVEDVADVWRWVADTDRTDLTSFPSICHHLSLNPDAVRAELCRRAQHVRTSAIRHRPGNGFSKAGRPTKAAAA
jgi:hypothetical protein